MYAWVADLRAEGVTAAEASDARLALLQRQLHPHFLFNALQAISTLLHRDPATADRLLVRLSDLLRAMLDGASGHTLSLRTELELIRNYLDIEQAAFRRPPDGGMARLRENAVSTRWWSKTARRCER